jgi:broad specificity phosphatase PhoE
MSAPELLLVRHGRSAHVVTGWLDVHDVRRWMQAYDAAEISPDHAPPPVLEALVASSERIVASDLPRAVASAIRLAPDRSIVRTPLLREAPLETPELPMPGLGGIRLPFRAWGMIWGARWLATWLRDAPPPGVDARTLARAEEAADWLVSQATEASGRVVVVTHATFRFLIARSLVQRGWRGPERRAFHEWSAWSYTPAGRDSASTE